MTIFRPLIFVQRIAGSDHARMIDFDRASEDSDLFIFVWAANKHNWSKPEDTTKIFKDRHHDVVESRNTQFQEFLVSQC